MTYCERRQILAGVWGAGEEKRLRGSEQRKKWVSVALYIQRGGTVTWRTFIACEKGCQGGLPACQHLKLVIVWKCRGGRRTFGCPPLYCSPPCLWLTANRMRAVLPAVWQVLIPIPASQVPGGEQEGRGLGGTLVDSVHWKC